MRMKTNSLLRLSCLLLWFASPLYAREKTDVLVMRNGDRLTCEIKSLSADTLSISLDYAVGTVSIDWGKVAQIESNQLFLVKTQNGLVYSGSLSTSLTPGARPAAIDVLEPSARRSNSTRLKSSISRKRTPASGVASLARSASTPSTTRPMRQPNTRSTPRPRIPANAGPRPLPTVRRCPPTPAARCRPAIRLN